MNVYIFSEGISLLAAVAAAGSLRNCALKVTEVYTRTSVANYCNDPQGTAADTKDPKE